MAQQRMLYVDNLRLGVIVLVVCMHVAVTYSGLGDWYYKEGLPLSLWELLFFAMFQSFLQAFFMGTLFLLAGYYAAASLKSKGTAAFIKRRLFRLGLPTLVYMLAIHPLTVYYLMDWNHTRFTMPFPVFYGGYLLGGHVLGGTGPMWFALALLIFCLGYAAVDAAKGESAASREPRPFPGGMPVLLALLAGAGAFALRLRWPIGTSVFNMQLCFFSQYVLLFCAGIVAHRNGWLERIDYGLARRCLTCALVGMPLVLAVYYLAGAFQGDGAFRGGMHWQSLAFSVWESFTGVFMSVGLVGVLREKWNTQGALTKSMSASAFAVYMFHPPILVFLSQVLRPVALGPLPKFLLVSALALPVCFAAARLIRAAPLLREIVKS